MVNKITQQEGETDEQKTVELQVTYDADGQPKMVEYYHVTFGLVKFPVEERTAVVHERWNRLSDKHLKPDFKRWISTGDVHRSVLQLPFIDEIDVRNLKTSPEDAEKREETA